MTIDFTRLQQLAQYIKALPAERFDLLYTIRAHNECGTVACAVGYAALAFPHWWTKVEVRNTYNPAVYWAVLDDLGSAHMTTDYQRAAMQAFTCSRAEAKDLFTTAGDSIYDLDASDYLSDRDLFLHRMHRFFADHGQTLELK